VTAPVAEETAPVEEGSAPSRSRKPFVAAAALGAVGLLVIGILAIVRSGEGSSSSADGGAVQAPTAEPEEQWSSDIDGSVNDVVISGDRAFVSWSDGDFDLWVSALGLDDGDEVWSEKIGQGNGSSMAVIDGELYISRSLDDGDGEMVVLSPDDGQEDRTFDTSRFYTFVPGGRGLLVAYDTEVPTFAVLEDGEDIGRRVDGYVVEESTDSLLLRDGDTITSYARSTLEADGPEYELDDDEGASATVAGGRVVQVDDGESLVATDADGERLWRTDLSIGTIYALHAIGEDRVVATGDEGYAFVRVGADEGEELWRERGGWVQDVQTDSGSNLALISANEEAEVVRLADDGPEDLGSFDITFLGEDFPAEFVDGGVYNFTGGDGRSGLEAFLLPEMDSSWDLSARYTDGYAWFHPVRDTVFAIEGTSGGNESTLTLYR
jgi:outer membrane protein assembly factor BamB